MSRKCFTIYVSVYNTHPPFRAQIGGKKVQIIHGERRYTNRNPWITRELKNDIKKRDELYKQKKRSPTPEKNTKTQTYQNRENLREITTMNNVISGPEPICLTTRKSQMDLNQITSEKDLCIRFQDDLHFTKPLSGESQEGELNDWPYLSQFPIHRDNEILRVKLCLLNCSQR